MRFMNDEWNIPVFWWNFENVQKSGVYSIHQRYFMSVITSLADLDQNAW